MIDIETVDAKPSSAVASFGAVPFDPYNGTVDVENAREWTINVPDQIRLGRTIDPGTVAWWFLQSEEARKSIIPGLNGKATPFTVFATEFDDWLKERGLVKSNSLKVWSHGATFDVVIMTDLYRTFNRTAPWRYVNARDTRTIFDIFKPEQVQYGTAHRAVDDAIKQAIMVCESYQKHKGSNNKIELPTIVESEGLPPYISRSEYFQSKEIMSNV